MHKQSKCTFPQRIPSACKMCPNISHSGNVMRVYHRQMTVMRQAMAVGRIYLNCCREYSKFKCTSVLQLHSTNVMRLKWLRMQCKSEYDADGKMHRLQNGPLDNSPSGIDHISQISIGIIFTSNKLAHYTANQNSYFVIYCSMRMEFNGCWDYQLCFNGRLLEAFLRWSFFISAYICLIHIFIKHFFNNELHADCTSIFFLNNNFSGK